MACRFGEVYEYWARFNSMLHKNQEADIGGRSEKDESKENTVRDANGDDLTGRNPTVAQGRKKATAVPRPVPQRWEAWTTLKTPVEW
jgi:hypothetical protein